MGAHFSGAGEGTFFTLRGEGASPPSPLAHVWTSEKRTTRHTASNLPILILALSSASLASELADMIQFKISCASTGGSCTSSPFGCPRLNERERAGLAHIYTSLSQKRKERAE